MKAREQRNFGEREVPMEGVRTGTLAGNSRVNCILDGLSGFWSAELCTELARYCSGRGTHNSPLSRSPWDGWKWAAIADLPENPRAIRPSRIRWPRDLHTVSPFLSLVYQYRLGIRSLPAPLSSNRKYFAIGSQSISIFSFFFSVTLWLWWNSAALSCFIVWI